jgi:mitogen-activated protein kinase 1/3
MSKAGEMPKELRSRNSDGSEGQVPLPRPAAKAGKDKQKDRDSMSIVSSQSEKKKKPAKDEDISKQVSDSSSAVPSVERTDSASPKERTRYVIGGDSFDIDSRYKPAKTIGSGSYGKVCLATDLKENKKVAIKKVKDVFLNTVDAKRILREIKLLRHFDHPNIVKIVDLVDPPSADEFKDLYIVMEYMQADLKKVIYSDNVLSEDHIAFIIYQVLCGLMHMHSAKVVHRDLKPGNILVNSNCKAKICDLGLARGWTSKEDSDVSEAMTEYVVTRWYRAPELTWGEAKYGSSIDMWAVGCILAEMFNRECLFKGENYVDQLALIVCTIGTPSDEDLKECVGNQEALNFIKNLGHYSSIPWNLVSSNASEAGQDLLSKLLVFNPHKRITAEEAIKHPFFKKFYDPKVLKSNLCAEPFDFDFEKLTRTKENIRDLMFREIVHYRPDAFKSKIVEEKKKVADHFVRKNTYLQEGRRRTVV